MTTGASRSSALVALAFVLAAMTPPRLAAAQQADPAKPLGAEEIVAHHVTACGGLEKMHKIRTLRERGRASAGADRQALVLRERKRPDRTRFEFTTQGVTGVFVSNGERGFRVSPFDGDTGPTPLPDDVVAEAAEQADIEGPLVDWKAKGHQIQLVGREVVDERETYKLKLTLKGGTVRHEYIDVETMLRVRTESTRHVRGRPVEIRTTYDDYRKSGGVQFPHRIEVAAAGRPQTLRIVVDKIEVNPPLDDARFEMPKTLPSTAPPTSKTPSPSS